MTAQKWLWFAEAVWFGVLLQWHWHLRRWHRSLQDSEVWDKLRR